MFFRRFLNKNLLLILALVILGSVFTVPQFLDEKKEVEPSEQKVEVSNKTSTQEEVESKPEVLSQESQENTTNSQPKSTQKQTQPSQQNTQTLPSTNEAGEVVSQQVSLNIHTGTGNYSYKVNWVENMTVFDALLNASKVIGFSLDYKNFGPCPAPEEKPKTCGAYITEIHGKSCECWSYTRTDANGNKLPANAASWERVQENNIITWKAT